MGDQLWLLYRFVPVSSCGATIWLTRRFETWVVSCVCVSLKFQYRYITVTHPIAVAGHLRIYLPTCEEISLLVYCILLGSILSTVMQNLVNIYQTKLKGKNYGKLHFLLFYLLGVHVSTVGTFGTHMGVCVCVRASLDRCAYSCFVCF